MVKKNTLSIMHVLKIKNSKKISNLNLTNNSTFDDNFIDYEAIASSNINLSSRTTLRLPTARKILQYDSVVVEKNTKTSIDNNSKFSKHFDAKAVLLATRKQHHLKRLSKAAITNELLRPVKTRKEKDKIKCIYCSKIYISISCHTKHQNSCQFNPVIAAHTNVSAFKSYLPKSGNCPECNQFYSRLPSHFGFCVSNSISDFTKYLHKFQNHQFVNIERVDDFNSLSELPFFDCIDLGDELVEP